MKFFITLNIPTKNNMSHQITAEHPAKSLQEFQDALHQEDFIMVEEFQRQTYGDLVSEGKLLINHRHIGKVRVYEHR